MRWVGNALTALGRPVLVLGTLTVLLLMILVPLTTRYALWLLESERIVEEIRDPDVVDYDLNGGDAAPRRAWAAGDTFYVVRHVCIWKVVAGEIEQTLSDTATIALDPVPLSGLLHLTGSAYGPGEVLKPPPWCGTRTLAASIPAFLAVGPVTYRATVEAHLNPARPNVRVSLRPVHLQITTTPVRARLQEHEREMDEMRRTMAEQVRLFSARQAQFGRQVAEARTLIERLKLYQSQLDAYLREKNVLPKPPAR